MKRGGEELSNDPPLFMGSQTVPPAPLLHPHGSEKVHCRRKQLSWRPAASQRRGWARWPALDGAGW